MYKPLLFRFIPALLLLIVYISPLSALEMKDWPHDVKVKTGSITIYQPQIESLEGDILKGRAAIAYNASGKSEPVFGAAWFKSQVEIDRSERMVQYVTLEVTETRFPEGQEGVGNQFAEAVKEGMKTWNLTGSLDDLTTSLAAATSEQEAARDLKVDPPEVIYKDKPAILINVDGKAVLKEIENTQYQAVINTPYPLIFDKKSKLYHLNAANGVWYQAKDVDGAWNYNPKPPAELASMVEDKEKQDGADKENSSQTITADNAPLIVVAHTPTELIVSEGKAEFKPLVEDVLVMSNTDGNVFMDVTSQRYYLIISGRWYKSKSMTGKWEYVESDSLPKSFASIPADSQYGDIRAYIAGTDEAHEAVMDAQIPQTATVQRGEVDIKVPYDGKPKFDEVKGTDLEYAVNTSESVLKTDSNAKTKYYMVKDAVWYISDSPEGPWVVSDHTPEGIDQIPPSSPVYNTKYVYVYDSTPEVVYTGYTPGYVGSYVYGPTIVYGTGWYYRPWITPSYYYPRQSTWGFNVSYNPWTGWGFGLSWNYGPFHFGFQSGGYWHGHSHYGRWGPGGYRPGYGNINNRHIKVGDINIDNSTNININKNKFNNISNNNLYRNKNQIANIKNTHDTRPFTNKQREDMKESLSRSDLLAGAGAGAAAGGLAAALDSDKVSKDDLRRKAETRDNSKQTKIAQDDIRNKAATRDKSKQANITQDDIRNKASSRDQAGTKNNVFTDKDGNIYRQNGDKWEARTNDKWTQVDRPGKDDLSNKPVVKSTRPASKPESRPSTKPAARPQTKPAVQTKAAQTKPATQRQSSTKAASGYNRPTKVERDQYSRQRSATRRQQSSGFSKQRSARSGRRG